jgi:hypothetical protein
MTGLDRIIYPKTLKNLAEEQDVIDYSKRNTPGVYFLIKDDVVVYVGQSVDVYGRIPEHEKDKDFDRAVFFKANLDSLLSLEFEYIVAFNPKYNKTHAEIIMLNEIRMMQEDQKGREPTYAEKVYGVTGWKQSLRNRAKKEEIGV